MKQQGALAAAAMEQVAEMATDDMGWLSGGGEMGELIRSMDWSTTPLGPVSGWPQSLRTSVSLCLSSTFPMLVAWGPEDVQIYNDAYRPICGAKHPQSMGEPFKICWATALPVVGDAFDRAHKGEGVYIRDQRMFLDRDGYLEEAFMTFSFSPIRAESGNVAGVFHPISEGTSAVLNARRTQNLRDLSGRIALARTAEELAETMVYHSETLAMDLPFMLLYEMSADGATLELRGRVGLPEDSTLAPAGVATADEDGWDFAGALRDGGNRRVDDLTALFGEFECEPYEDAPESAMVLPLTVAGQERPYGFLVAGVSIRRALDDAYLNFYELLRGAFNTAVGNVLAYEQEQKRAAALAQIDQAKTAFFSNVSHEFRTPLTLILGPLEDALADTDDALSPRQRARIDVTNRNALRLLKLVNSLLDFSRIEAGRVQARFAPVDLAQVTANLGSVFEAAMDKAGLAYIVETTPLAQPVYVDLDMWEKVVFNLLSNAFKFTMYGGVTVRLGAAPGGNGARLTVRDTGSGVPPAELPRIFERFHRVEGAQGRSYEGTGIGLALIQELVRLHGGTISADSQLGAGTTFTVDIPFGAGHLPAEYVVARYDSATGDRMGAAYLEEALRWLPDEAPALQGDAAAPGTGTVVTPAVAGARNGARNGGPQQRARILIADDNQDMRGYVRSLLERDYTVETCADGEAALKAVRRNPPDLLLSDVMMPRLDGFGLLKQVRADERIRHVPVILLSARAGEEARIEGLQAGADDYLVKPFSANELLARVHSHIELLRERQKVTVQLREREEYFRSLVNASQAMFWTTDEHHRCNFLSQRWVEYTGRALHEDLGDGWMELIHPDDMARIGIEYAAATAMRKPFSFDYRLRDRHGRYRWVIDAGAPRFGADGQVTGYIGTVIDVHDRRILQDRFANVARASGIGVWYADAPLAAMQVNAQLRTQFALPADGLVAVDEFLGRVHAEDRPRVQDEFRRAMDNGAGYESEFRVAPAPGQLSPRWIRMIAWAQHDEQGAVVHFDGVTLDVTDQKSDEYALRNQAGELSQANQAQREFLVTLAHELRNPLAPIRSGLEMMRAQQLAHDEIERIRAMMERQVGHLVHLVDDLLDLARIARGKEVLAPVPTDLGAVVRTAVELSTPLITARNHALTVSVPGHVQPLWLDAQRIAQVIGNLLNNAAKYTPEGGRIELRAAVSDGELTISVSDNGVGIPAEALGSVFDMFTQVPGSEAQAQGGLGIGLNLVRRLTELHGGKVSAHSAGAGQGSTFTLHLPANLPDQLQLSAPPAGAAVPLPATQPSAVEGRAAADHEPVVEAQATPERIDQASSVSLRVLVVDDNVDAAETLAALFEIKGHVVRTVHDGLAALDAAEAFRPHVVFLDIGLPGMNGHDVARALRAAPHTARATLVALTGWGTESDRLKSGEAGFDHHLTKPVSFDEIVRMMADLAVRPCRPGRP